VISLNFWRNILHNKTLLKSIYLVLVLTLSACAALPVKPEPPVVTLAGLRIVSVDFFEQRFALDLRLMNPNDKELSIKGMDYELLLDDTRFARGVSASSITLPALGETVVQVESVTNLLSLYRQLQSLGASGEPAVRYQLKGNIRLMNQAFKLPFNKQGEVVLK
jgi:LEA14-like dessication related protein